jgi:ribonuclease P protein component
VIVGKHGHTIVERNLLRRRLRELVRLKILPVISPMDVVFRTLSSAYDVRFDDLAAEVEQLAVQLVTVSRAQ